MSYAPVKTARTWDSYRETLIKVLTIFNPSHVLEYGPGESTKIMQAYHSVQTIDTVEHNDAWSSKIKENLNHKVVICTEPNEFKYTYFQGRFHAYDLIFIDGLNRTNCLAIARLRLTEHGTVILHDAERPEYKAGIDLYAFKFPVDDGHTMVLTDNKNNAFTLSDILW